MKKAIWVTATLPWFFMGALACDQGVPPVSAERGTAIEEPQTRTAGTDDPVAIAQDVHRLELKAAAQLYGDPSGESEGDEDQRHTFIASSLAILRVVVKQDSLNARAWFLLGDVLSARAYRGFGSWNLADQRAAVAALQRARAVPNTEMRFRSSIDSALADKTRTLREVERP